MMDLPKVSTVWLGFQHESIKTLQTRQTILVLSTDLRAGVFHSVRRGTMCYNSEVPKQLTKFGS